MTSHLKVALYARVSGKKQDNGNQLIQLREFAAKQDGWEIVREYVELAPARKTGRSSMQ